MDNLNKQLSLVSLIEAILFYTAEPMSFKKLSNLTKSTIAEIKESALVLSKRLEENDSGIRLISQHDEIALGTAPLAGPIIEEITREEISKELSKASLETLAIICYKGPLTRSDVDYIRGVNSTFIIRNLLIRGIIEKLDNPRDSRAMLYGPTLAALEYMGVTKIDDLPQYSEIQATLAAFNNERINDEEPLKQPNKSDVADEPNEVRNGDADSAVLLCDVDNDGIMTEEECFDSSDFIIHSATEDIDTDNIEADISEENVMSPEFDNDEVLMHNAKDEEIANK